jgi:hypothetical protein
MTAMIARPACLLLCLLALACGSGKEEPAPAAPKAAQALKCPVCASEFPRDRMIVVQDPCGEVFVCSEGCAIRWSVRKAPLEGPDTRSEADADSRPAEER